MTISSRKKCEAIHQIHVQGLSYQKTANAIRISLSGVKTAKNEFCEASGLKLVSRGDDSGNFFGGTLSLIDALGFQQESITRILDVLLKVRTDKPYHNLWLLDAYEIFFEEVGTSSDWVKKALFELVLEGMNKELEGNVNWHPYGEERAVDLSRFEEGGNYFWLVERARKYPKSKLEEFLDYSIKTNQKGGKSTSTLGKQLQDAGFRKINGMWVEHLVSTGSGSGLDIFQTEESKEHIDESCLPVGESDETTGMAVNEDEVNDSEENQHPDSQIEDLNGSDCVPAHGLQESFMAEALREEAKKFRNQRKGLRILAIAELFDGKELAEVAKTFGVDEKTLKKWLKNFTGFGIDGLSDKGNPGRPRKLADELWEDVSKLVEAGPDIEKDKRVIWRLSDIRRKIDEMTGDIGTVAISTVSRNLKRLKFRRLMPRKKHPKQNPKHISQFKRIFPRLVKSVRNKYPGVKEFEIWFGDESRFGQKNGLLRVWSRIRQTAPTNAGYLNTNLLGAVCPGSGKCAAWLFDHVNTEAMEVFLMEISGMVAKGAHAIVVLDRAAWHTTQKLKIPENITLIFLPPYCPELNPIEIVWADLKKDYFANQLFENKKEIEDAVCKAWNEFSESSDKFQTIFKNAMEWAMVSN